MLICRISSRFVALGAVLALVSVVSLPAAEAAPAPEPEGSAAAPLSKRHLKRLQREVDSALAAGKLETAITGSERLTASLPEGDPRRADALYSLAISLLLRADEPSDMARATAALGQLESSYPRFERRVEVGAALAGLRSLADARVTAEQQDQALAELKGQLGSRTAEVAACSSALEAQQAAVSEAMKGQSRELQAEVERLRDRLTELEDELAQKEETLQKVKATLVGG